MKLLSKREIWAPTRLGFSLLFSAIVAPFIFWLLWGEAFLTTPPKVKSEILIVESWTLPGSAALAADAFTKSNYTYIVIAGSWHDSTTSESEQKDKNHALIFPLTEANIPEEKIIIANGGDHQTQRTYHSARAAMQQLENLGILPKYINVITHGPHARRSRLVYDRVAPPDAIVGAIAWKPEYYNKTDWWWENSTRAKEFIGESAAYFHELLFGWLRDNQPD